MLDLTQNYLGASISAWPEVKVGHLFRSGPRMHCTMQTTQMQLELDTLNKDLPCNRKELFAFFLHPYVAFWFPNQASRQQLGHFQCELPPVVTSRLLERFTSEDEESHPRIFMSLTSQCSFGLPFNGRSAFQMTVHVEMRFLFFLPFQKSGFSFRF